MRLASDFFTFLMLLIISATGIAAELQGPSKAAPGDVILVRMSDDVPENAPVILLLDGEPQKDGFKVADKIIEITKAQAGEYRIVVKHGSEYLIKAISVSAAGPAAVSAAGPASASAPSSDEKSDDDLVAELRKLKDVDDSFADHCKTLAAAFSAEGAGGGLLKVLKLTDDAPALSPVEDAWQKSINTILAILTQSGITDDAQKGRKLAELLTTAAGNQPSTLPTPAGSQPSTPPTLLGGPAAQPAASADPLTAAIRERLFQSQVNDFDPRFQQTCQDMAKAVTDVIKQYEGKPDSADAVKDFRLAISAAVRGVIQTVPGTDAGEAKKRWNDFYDEYRTLLLVLEYPASARSEQVGDYWRKFQSDKHAYAGIVTSDRVIGREDLKAQIKAFEAFAAALNESVERDKQEVESVLNRYGMTSQPGAATGSSFTGGYGAPIGPYSGRVIDRLFNYKMRAMQYRHEWRMSKYAH